MPTPEEKDRIALGAKLKESREYLGFSQDDVARVMNIARAAISLIESGQRKVEVSELKKMATLFQRPVSHFTGEMITAPPLPPTMQALARKAEKLSEADWEELARFADYLASRARARRIPKS